MTYNVFDETLNLTQLPVCTSVCVSLYVCVDRQWVHQGCVRRSSQAGGPRTG